jgi:hypothetical protein
MGDDITRAWIDISEKNYILQQYGQNVYAEKRYSDPKSVVTLDGHHLPMVAPPFRGRLRLSPVGGHLGR